MGKVKEAARGLPKTQKRHIKKVADKAHRTLLNNSLTWPTGTRAAWTDPGLIGEGEVSFMSLARERAKLLGKRALVSFEERSTDGTRFSDGRRDNYHQVDRASLSIEWTPKDGEAVEAEFDFLKDPVREMIRLAGSLPCEPATPLEERVDLACSVLQQAAQVTG